MSTLMLDANVVLRYLLNDNQEMAAIADETIHSRTTTVSAEVIAEVVYVLDRVYNTARSDVADCLCALLDEVEATNAEVIREGLRTYAMTRLDFVDCLLYGYQKIEGYEILTFDKKLKKLLSSERISG